MVAAGLGAGWCKGVLAVGSQMRNLTMQTEKGRVPRLGERSLFPFSLPCLRSSRVSINLQAGASIDVLRGNHLQHPLDAHER